MPKGLAAALLAGLKHRAHGLTAYLRALEVESASADPRHAMAIDLMVLAIEKTVQTAELNIRVRTPDEQARSLLNPLIGSLRRIHAQADLSFARGHQTQVPKALLGAVDREIHTLGLPRSVIPVLTIGAPNNYETLVADLYDELFQNIPKPLLPPKPDQSVCLMSLPFVEGTRALWQPLVLGHEVAHLALRHLPALLPDVKPWLVDDKTTKALRTREGLIPSAAVILKSWVEEIICDLRSVRRYGVAGLAAQADFLHAVGAANPRDEDHTTHPPLRLRLQFMLNELGATNIGSLPPILDEVVEPWRASAPLSPPGDMRWATALWQIAEAHAAEIHVAAAAVPGGAYGARSRVTRVTTHRDRLVAGIPGSTPIAKPTQKDWADVLTAGWTARSRVMQKPSEAGDNPLAMLDDLVGKAVDILHFAKLWTSAGGEIGPPPDTRTAATDLQTQEPGEATDLLGALGRGDAGALGVLAEQELVRRTVAGIDCDPDNQGEALIVTPLFPTAAKDVGLDVHLSNQFIVFRRSSTAAFSSIDDAQDPREMQELVERDWHRPFVLHPGELVLAATLEYMALPADLTAQVITRSSYGRLGLLSATAVQVHPFFAGCLTLELVNLGQMPLELTPGERIAQLVFQRVLPATPEQVSTYRHPVGPEFSKVKRDRDLIILRKIKLEADVRARPFRQSRPPHRKVTP